MNTRWLWLPWLLLASVASAEAAPVTLSGRVLGASGKHTVHIALWRSEGFLTRPVAEVRLIPGTAMNFKFDVAPGQWALSAFEDRNENGHLDMGLFGPTEPSGFWRPFTAWRKPKFEEVRAVVTHDTANAIITIK